MKPNLEEILGDLREIEATAKQIISRKELAERLLAVKGANFITFTAYTDTDCRKTGNPWTLPIMKRSKVRGVVNFQYIPGVRRRLEEEGKDPDGFTPGKSWHTAVLLDGKVTPLSAHKKDPSRLYLRFMYLDTLARPAYFDGQGQERQQEEIASFLKDKQEYKNQGLEAPLQFHVYGLPNIEEATFAGSQYTLSNAL